MGLEDPISMLDPPVRPPWRSQLSTPQIGPLCEDLLAVSLTAAGSGLATIGYPTVDRGVDLYLRRLRSLLTIPIQSKGFTHVSPDGSVAMDLLVSDVHDAPGGHLALVHLPAPYDQLYRRLFLIPISVFRQRCPVITTGGKRSFRFVASLASGARDLWSDHLIDIDDLPKWLAAIPGWTDPIPPAPTSAMRPLMALGDRSRPDSFSEAHIGRLWVMSEIERAGRNRIVIAEDRVRLDTVTLLLHHTASGQIAGLHIRTGLYPADRRIHFDVKRGGFFVAPKLFVMLVLLDRERRPRNFCLLIPSEKIPALGYSETVTLDPLTKRFRPFQVPIDELGSVLVERIFS